jgi:hypothetical protein
MTAAVTGTASKGRPRVKLVVTDEATWEKPYEDSCGACRSPYGDQIDQALAEGWSYRSVQKFFASRRPACPNMVILRYHVDHGHLIPPHLKARLAFEEAAQERGSDTASESATGEDALAAIIRQGTAQLLSGMTDVRPSDMVAAVRLQEQIARSRDGEGVEASAWQSAFVSFFELVRGYLTPDQWRQFVGDAYSSPEIRAVLARDDRSLPGGPGG